MKIRTYEVFRLEREFTNRHGQRRTTKGCLPKGEPNRRIIATAHRRGLDYALHATKGWRLCRQAEPAARGEILAI